MTETTRRPVNEDFDPLSDDYLADPYPYYARFREEAPVFYAPKIDFWVVSRYEDIQKIVTDPETYSNVRVQEPITKLEPEALDALKAGVRVVPTTSTADPPAHRRTRSLASKAFSARRVKVLEPRIEELTSRLIDDFEPDGRAEMVRQFAFPLPAQVMFSFIGFPEEDTEKLKSWCYDRLLISFGRPKAEKQLPTIEKMSALFQYIEDYVHYKQHDLADDYTSDLFRTRTGGEDDLTLEEITSICYSLAFAGHETTTGMISNALRRILSRPGLAEELRNDPSLIENAVEEILRFDTSVVAWRRLTKKPVEISGVEIPEGERILVLLASANRDETVFENPNDFDIRRENAGKHLSFSRGIHFCLGAPLARLEMKIALRQLTERLPDLRLAPEDQSFDFNPNISFRGPGELHAEWTT